MGRGVVPGKGVLSQQQSEQETVPDRKLEGIGADIGAAGEEESKCVRVMRRKEEERTYHQQHTGDMPPDADVVQ